MQYDHTQKAPLHYILYGVVVAMLPLLWAVGDEPGAVITVSAVMATLLVVSGMFRTLTVRDEGYHLAVRYGPLPVFAKIIRYSEIKSVEADRTKVIDGWGIHWVPGRGTTYNLWGFDCVKLEVGNRVIRIGSDDVENLVEFLRERLAS
jgi:hypothetical protein